MADQSFQLALKMMESEVSEVIGALKDSNAPAVGVTDDEKLALELWKEEIDSESSSLHDHQLALKVARIPGGNAALISAIFQEEERSKADHQMALRLGRRTEVENEPTPSLYQEQTRQVAKLIVSQDTKGSSLFRGQEVITSNVTGEIKPIEHGVECMACSESDIYFRMIKAPCSHFYCHSCLINLFKASVRDRSLFPPRCCTIPIKLEAVRTIIGPSISQQVERKIIETNDTSRTYCWKESCSAHILPNQKSGTCATCQECALQTCTLCNGKYHLGRCQRKPNPVLQLAEEKGWKRCSQCKHLVELNTGCNHITCHCGYEFCYVCGSKWKTCECPQWDEHNLLEAQGALEQRRACTHLPWARRDGSFECGRCQETLGKFIYECTRCRVRRCRRCRFNRA